MSHLDESLPILYMSEILELYKQIDFTKKEVQDASVVSVNVVSNLINQLVKLGIIIPDSSVIKKGYCYQKIYEVFIDNKVY